MSDDKDGTQGSAAYAKGNALTRLFAKLTAKDERDQNMAVADLVIALATVISVAIAGLAYFVSRYSLETARRQLTVTDRPWLKLSAVKIIQIDMRRYDIILSGYTSVNNIGKSPALNVNIAGTLSLRHNDLTGDISDQCKDTSGEYADTRMAIFPDEHPLDILDNIRMKKLRLTDRKPQAVVDKSVRARSDIEPKETYRFADKLFLTVCATYNVYNDPNLHHTVSTYEISKRTADGAHLGDDAAKFDLSDLKTYSAGEIISKLPSRGIIAD